MTHDLFVLVLAMLCAGAGVVLVAHLVTNGYRG